MHVVLTGSSGWLGRFLAPRLRAAGHSVVGLDVAAGPDTQVFGSVPKPFARGKAHELARDAAAVVERHFPEARALYSRQGWVLPARIGRVYDASRIERVLGWRCQTDFAALLRSLREGHPLPFVHDPGYVSPAWVAARS